MGLPGQESVAVSEIRKQLNESRRYDAFGKLDDSAEFVLVDAGFLDSALAVYEAAVPFAENVTPENWCELKRVLESVQTRQTVDSDSPKRGSEVFWVIESTKIHFCIGYDAEASPSHVWVSFTDDRGLHFQSEHEASDYWGGVPNSLKLNEVKITEHLWMDAAKSRQPEGG